jgi:WxL domain surface cell wall-binding
MRTTRHRFTRTFSTRTRILGVIAAAALVAVATAKPAPADPPSFDSGAGFPTVGNFNPVTLNGTDQLSSASIAPFVVTDDSGALAGWNVTLLVPDFRNGTGADCATGATASIAGANVSMKAPVVTAADAFTSMTGVTAEGFTDFTTPRKIISAAVGEGAGTYDVAPEMLKLIVPANTLVGAYCAQATIAITSGP